MLTREEGAPNGQEEAKEYRQATGWTQGWQGRRQIEVPGQAAGSQEERAEGRATGASAAAPAGAAPARRPGFRLAAAALALSLVALAPAAAWADLVTLTDGVLTLNVGTIGNTFRVDVVATGPAYHIVANAGSGGPPSCDLFCPPGHGFVGNFDLSSNNGGVVTYQGVTYTGGGPLIDEVRAETPAVTLPALTTLGLTLHTPFHLFIRNVLDPCRADPPQPCEPGLVVPPTIAATGDGIATFTFVPVFNPVSPLIDPFWRLTSGHYDILTPVPEPATWVLALTGLGIVGLARLFRKRGRP